MKNQDRKENATKMQLMPLSGRTLNTETTCIKLFLPVQQQISENLSAVSSVKVSGSTIVSANVSL